MELSRQSYEAGDWASAVREAWTIGRASKAIKRANGAAGTGMDTRRKEGLDMARKVIQYARGWLGSSHMT